MKDHDYRKLLSSLDAAIDILDRNRTPDAALVAAFDTLKQARARVVRALEQPKDETHENRFEFPAIAA